MTAHTLLARIYTPRQLRQIEKQLRAQFEGLNVNSRIIGTVVDKWAQVDISGEDESIATNYLAKEFGFCPETLISVRKFAALKGYITDLRKSGEALFLDVGIFQPAPIYAQIPLQRLQAQIVDGRKLALNKIAEIFGFCEDLPLNVKITAVDKTGEHLEAELTTLQAETYITWEESLLDRLIVVGSINSEINRTLSYTGLNRDIIAVEPLGPFEQVLTCKLGTDAAGLISKIGRNLRNTRIEVFSPRRIRQFFKTEDQPAQ